MCLAFKSSRYSAQSAILYSPIMGESDTAFRNFYFHVIGMGFQNDKICGVIITLISVAMMNNFTGQQFSTKHLRSNNSVCRDGSDLSIVFRVLCLINSAARNRAIDAVTLSNIRLLNGEVFSTIATVSIFSFRSRHRITRLRTIYSFAWPIADWAYVFHTDIISHSMAKVNNLISPHCLKPDTGQLELVELDAESEGLDED